MTTSREFFTVASPARFAIGPLIAASFVLLVGAACTQPVTAQIPISDGWGPGGGGPSGSGSTSSSSGSSSGSKSSSSSSGSGSGGVSSSGGSGGTGYDAGNPNAPDTGANGTDAGGGGAPDGGGNQNAGGCMNIHCATDTNECGCQATDSNGEQVLLGCQAGGDCVCLINGNPDGQPFPEDGACADQSSTESQFLSNCTCQ